MNTLIATSCKICALSLLLTVFACSFSRALADLLPHDAPCSSLPANCPSLLSGENRTLSMEYRDRLLTLFHGSAFDLHAGASFNSSFTFTSTQKPAPKALLPPTLAFLLSSSPSSQLQSPAIYYTQLTFTCNEMDNTSVQSTAADLLPVCNSARFPAADDPRCRCLILPSEGEKDEVAFKEVVGLEYIASTGELHAQATHYQEDEKVATSTFTSIIPNSEIQSNESSSSLLLLVGYITYREATINLTINDVTSTTPYMEVSNSPSIHEGHHHNMTFLWILVASFLVVFLAGLTILMVLIKKHNERRPKAVSSCLANKHGVTPTGTRPLQRDIEEACEMPMIHNPSFTPPHLEASDIPILNNPSFTPPHYSDSQALGTASWLKQPGPR